MTDIKLRLHNMKIVFSKRKMKHFIVGSIVIVLGESMENFFCIPRKCTERAHTLSDYFPSIVIVIN